VLPLGAATTVSRKRRDDPKSPRYVEEDRAETDASRCHRGTVGYPATAVDDEEYSICKEREHGTCLPGHVDYGITSYIRQ
jgi:hypothetical protein